MYKSKTCVHTSSRYPLSNRAPPTPSGFDLDLFARWRRGETVGRTSCTPHSVFANGLDGLFGTCHLLFLSATQTRGEQGGYVANNAFVSSGGFDIEA